MKNDKTQKKCTFLRYIGVTVLALLMLVSIVGAEPYAYIANNGISGNVTVIDTATNIVVDTVNVGEVPWGVAITPDGSKVYVTNQVDSTVSVIDAATNTVTVTLNLGDFPSGIAITPDGTKAYVASNPNKVSVIDTTTNTVTATVSMASNAAGIAVSPDGTKVYATNWDGGTVSVIDTATNTVTATVPVGSYPYGVAVSPDGTKVYVTNCDSGSVSVVDTLTNTVTATINAGDNPWGVAITPDGSKAYVTNVVDNTVSVIDAATNTVTATFNVGSGPNGVAVTPRGTEVYVVNYLDKSVSVIDATTNTITSTVNVGYNLVALGQFIGPLPMQPILPSANFSTNVTNGYAPLAVQFNDSSENATELNWDFENDGNTDSTEANPVHIYSAQGIYTVNLIATNQNGTNSKLGTITVLEQTLPPVANFTSNATQGYAPLTVQFTDSSENATEWKWDFGDRTYSTERNPVHTYNKAGRYTVSLTVENANGMDTEIKSKYISVSNLKGKKA